MKFNLHFVGRTYYKIKKFFAKPNWETIWTCEASGRRTSCGYPIGEYKKCMIIVRYAENKGKMEAYGTDGVVHQDIDIHFLIAQSEELENILKTRRIKIQ